VSVVLEEIRESGGRVKGNGTLGNVQGNHLSEQMEKLNRNIAGGGILGDCLIYQCSFLSPFPCTTFNKRKSQARIRATPCHARLLGHFLLSLDSFYFPKTGFI